jgi:hypothetical protein
MIRKLLDRLNPTRQLPAAMRRYLALPGWLVLAWLLVSGLFVLLPALLAPAGPSVPAQLSAGEPAPGVATPIIPPEFVPAPVIPALPAATLAGNSPAPLPTETAITVSGSAAFTLKRRGDAVLLSGPGLPPLQLANDGESLRVQTPEGLPLYRLKVKEADQGKIYDAAGHFLFRLKCEAEDGEETCKLYDAAGNRLNRVKLKADGFNVYGPGSERLYKGKFKNGAWQLRDEGDSIVLTLRGPVSLREAALLAMPVDPAVRVLLWRHAGQ